MAKVFVFYCGSHSKHSFKSEGDGCFFVEKWNAIAPEAAIRGNKAGN
ncbi:hypothetical protein [Paenibacillus sp. FJAT-27812]|nr:hypothetical protein [Paenibacillus sp. FJAT-27812]